MGKSVNKTVDVSKLELNPIVEEALMNLESKHLEATSNLRDSLLSGSGDFKIPPELMKCLSSDTAPRTIQDLTDGISLDSYRFEKENQATLGILGFGNVEIGNKETVIVVEYKQSGSQYCNNNQLFYGVGARMLLHVKNKKEVRS